MLPLNLLNSASPAGTTFRIVGVSNIIKTVVSIESDLSIASYEKLGTVAKKAKEVIDQRLFAIEDFQIAPESPPKVENSNVFILYYDNKGNFKYRNLTADLGQPTGLAESVLKIKKKRLKWMDVTTYGPDVLLAFSEMRNKKNYQVHFFKFSVE